MFRMNKVFCRRKSYIFIATGDVILTSYLHVCKYGFTTGFTVEDRHLIKCLGISWGYGATRLCKMFPGRRWNVDGVKTLLKKIDMTGSIDRQRGSGRPRSAHTPANINEVEVLAFTQEVRR